MFVIASMVLPLCGSDIKNHSQNFSAKAVLDAPKWEDVTAEYPDRPLLSGDWDWATQGKFAKLPKARVVRDEYGPHFEVNGAPYFPFCGWVNVSRRPDRRTRVGDLPVNTVTVYTRHWWKGEETLDTAVFDRAAESYCREYPDAYFFWDLSTYPSLEWAAAHPEDLAMDDTGAINMVGDMTNDVPNFCFASRRARRDIRKMMLKALDYLEHSPYANRILGYRVNSGHSIEWLYWYPEHGRELDFNPQARKGFREFCAKHHPSLRDTSTPSRAERRALDDGRLLWDPARHEKAIAYWDYLSFLTCDFMLDIVGAAKERLRECGSQKLVGTYYGYTMTLNYDGISQWRAHYRLKDALDANLFDFLISPPDYTTRNAGGTCTDMKPFASMNAHGIVTIVESDLRTAWGPFLTGNHHAKYQMPTAEKSLGLIARDMSFALCRNQPMSMYAICTGTDFDDPRAAALTGKLRKVGEKCLAGRTRRRAEVAVVVSEETVKAMPAIWRDLPNGELEQLYVKGGKVLTRERYFSIPCGENNGDNYVRYARAGAPVDYVLAEDLVDNPGDYKLYIFTNAYVYDRRFLEAVEKLRRRSVTVLWSYAPGYASEGRNSLANMERLTGIRFGEEAQPTADLVTFADGSTMGTAAAIVSPVFFVQDPAAETIATYADGRAGVAVKKTGGALSIFAGVWQWTVPFLTDVYRRAGVHVYSDSSDPIEANDDLVAIHARFPGRKTVRLPHPAKAVQDALSGETVALDAREFSFDMKLHETRLFILGKGD